MRVWCSSTLAHRSNLENYGLDATLERERYARYMAHFGIRPEQSQRSSWSAKSSPLLALVMISQPGAMGPAGKVGRC
jgi:hypothetical protein